AHRCRPTQMPWSEGPRSSRALAHRRSQPLWPRARQRNCTSLHPRVLHGLGGKLSWGWTEESGHWIVGRGLTNWAQVPKPPSALWVFPELRARRCTGRVLTASAISCNRLTADEPAAECWDGGTG